MCPNHAHQDPAHHWISYIIPTSMWLAQGTNKRSWSELYTKIKSHITPTMWLVQGTNKRSWSELYIKTNTSLNNFISGSMKEVRSTAPVRVIYPPTHPTRCSHLVIITSCIGLLPELSEWTGSTREKSPASTPLNPLPLILAATETNKMPIKLEHQGSTLFSNEKSSVTYTLEQSLK